MPRYAPRNVSTIDATLPNEFAVQVQSILAGVGGSLERRGVKRVLTVEFCFAKVYAVTEPSGSFYINSD